MLHKTYSVTKTEKSAVFGQAVESKSRKAAAHDRNRIISESTERVKIGALTVQPSGRQFWQWQVAPVH